MGVGGTGANSYELKIFQVAQSRSRSFEITDARVRVNSYYLSILMCVHQSCTVNAIFNVEYWRDLEILARGRSRWRRSIDRIRLTIGLPW